jgi:diadenosine tetraphosphate (Ap4A) HIT family hydrolase
VLLLAFNMSTLIHRRVEAARQRTNPTVICRVKSGWIVLGDVQFLPGYSLLLPDPVVADLNSLTLTQRIDFLQDMTILGDALLAVTGASRINYEILGNSEAALHAHVFPRYATEPEEKRQKPVWFYDWKSAVSFDAERDRQLMQEIAKAIQRYQDSA